MYYNDGNIGVKDAWNLYKNQFNGKNLIRYDGKLRIAKTS